MAAAAVVGLLTYAVVAPRKALASAGVALGVWLISGALLELAERLNPKTGEPDPVILRTEEPGRHDTEVTYGTDEGEGPKGMEARRKELAAEWDREAVDDDE